MYDPKNGSCTYQYDAVKMNNVATVTDSNGGVTIYTYSLGCGCPTGGSENLVSITDAKAQTTQFEYNGIGQVTIFIN
jgi:hypothetical protein